MIKISSTFEVRAMAELESVHLCGCMGVMAVEREREKE